MATSSLPNIKVSFTTPGTKQIIHKVTANGLTTESVTEIVIKPEPPAPEDVTGFPPVTTLSQVTIQNLDKPKYLLPVIDYTYGYPIKITRVTDATIFKATASPYVLDPGYSKQQNWNKDLTLFKLGRRHLLNAADNYKYIKSMGTPTGTTHWSNIDPQKLYVFGAGKISSFSPLVSPASAAVTTIADFNGMGYDTTTWDVGNAEGTIDLNDQYVVIITKKTITGSLPWYLCIDMLSGTIVSEISETDLDASGGVDWAGISQSGNYIVVNKNPTKVKYVYDRNWTLLRTIGTGDHMDFGFDSSGNEIMTKANWPRMVRLDTGASTDLIPASTMTAVYGDNVWGGHSSGQAYEFPGWSLHSLQTPANPLKEIIAIKNDGSQDVMRFCPSRRASTSYNSETQASWRRDGKAICFASDWGIKDGNIDTYIAELG